MIHAFNYLYHLQEKGQKRVVKQLSEILFGDPSFRGKIFDIIVEKGQKRVVKQLSEILSGDPSFRGKILDIIVV